MVYLHNSQWVISTWEGSWGRRVFVTRLIGKTSASQVVTIRDGFNTGANGSGARRWDFGLIAELPDLFNGFLDRRALLG